MNKKRYHFKILKENKEILEKLQNKHQYLQKETTDTSASCLSQIKITFSHFCPFAQFQQVIQSLQYNSFVLDLELSNNTFHKKHHVAGGERAKEIANLLTMNDTIQTIDISLCDMGDIDLGYILNALRRNRSITTLYLSILNGENAKVMSKFLSPNTEHDIFRRILCQILGKEGAQTIAQDLIPVNTTLKELRLDIHHGILKGLSQSLGANKSVEILQLSIRMLSQSDVQSIADILETNTTLRKIHLFWYDWFDKHPQDVNILAKGLSKNTTLRVFRLEKVVLTGDEAYTITHALEQNTSLIELGLYIVNDMEKVIKSFVQNLTLQRLELWCKELTVHGVEYLLKWILQSSKTRRMKVTFVYFGNYLDNNLLAGKLKEQIVKNSSWFFLDIKCSNAFN